LREMRERIADGSPLVGTAAEFLPPGLAAAAPWQAGPGGEAGEPFLVAPIGDCMPGWRLGLYLKGEDPFAAAARQQIAAYLWTGGMVVAAIVILAGMVARAVGRQARLTRLKNDLIATVSHELKTPLASMRILVDTLAEGRAGGPVQQAEYLRMISHENLRLSRLIDNFLTFSRMERNKRAFEFAPVSPADIVADAVRAAGERFSGAGCQFTVDVADALPTITADRDAMVTVLLNLLDNACKYTGADKRISLAAFAEDGRVCFRVTDNGIGLSRRAVRRVFDRFYQVDRSLSRPAGGCGLGLSIVRFIVDAHGGAVIVASRSGEGSTFTVRLPVARNEGTRAECAETADRIR